MHSFLKAKWDEGKKQHIVTWYKWWVLEFPFTWLCLGTLSCLFIPSFKQRRGNKVRRKETMVFPSMACRAIL
jgi:hypothetical protein